MLMVDVVMRVLQFLYHLRRGHSQRLGHLHGAYHHEDAAEREGEDDGNSQFSGEFHDEGHHHNHRVAGDGGGLQPHGPDLTGEDLELDHVEEGVGDGDAEPEEEEPDGLDDLHVERALLLLLAGEEDEDGDGDGQRQRLRDVDGRLALPVVDDEVADDGREHLRGADEHPVEVDAQRVVLEREFGRVELEGGEEVQEEAEDGQRAQGIEAEEVEDGDHVVVLLFLVLLVLCFDVGDLLEREVVVRLVVPRSDGLQTLQRFFGSVVDDEVEGGFLDVEEQSGEAHQQRQQVADHEYHFPVADGVEEQPVERGA
jgi:hypothetical protein